MLIRDPISRDFFQEEPYSVHWVGPAIVAAALLAGVAALFYGMLNAGMPPLDFDVPF
jgi:hypothetical protein